MIQASALFKNLVTGLTGLYDKNEATSIAGIVFKEKLNISRTDMALEPTMQITKQQEDKIIRASKHLLEGCPIQYVLGYADFCGMRLKVNENTLIPRPETEELVKLIVDKYGKRPHLHILDIGTGNGCIAIALKKALNDPMVSALDISAKALKVAKMNALTHNAEIKFIRHDIFNNKDFDERWYRYDIIVSNPPYVAEKEKIAMHINVLNYEPHAALFVPDEDPLKYYKRIADVAYRKFWEDGNLFLEVNPEYCQSTKEIFYGGRFKNRKVYTDFSSKKRFISCQVNFPPKPRRNIWPFDSLGG